jgi:exodeoxyribonuclease V alpha subunit
MGIKTIKKALFKAYYDGHSFLRHKGIEYYTKEKYSWKKLNKIISENDNFILVENKIFLKSIYEVEKTIANELIKRFRMPLEEELELIVDKGITLSENQEKAVKNACKYNISIITGGAGSGKSTVSRAVYYTLKQKYKNILLLSPTGAASERLSSVIEEKAETIHKALNHNTQRSLSNNQLEADAIIIDETSMVDTEMFLELLKKTNLETKIIIIGDVNQLTSVGPGEILNQLLEAFPKEKITKLDKIFRIEKTNEVAIFADNVLNGTLDTSNIFRKYKKSKNLNIIRYKKNIIDYAIKSFWEEDEECIILTSKRKKNILEQENTNQLNAKTRNLINKYNKAIKHGDKKLNFKKEDKIMFLKNDYNRMIFNGTKGKILQQLGNEILVLFKNNRIKLFQAQEFKPEISINFELSYAITIHKAQGQEFDNVLLILDDHKHINKNLFYTAITRTKKNLTIITTDEVLNQINNTQDHYLIDNKLYKAQKNTYLKELIKIELDN